ncbi:hypothetical protein CANARDRAFT_200946 [[Candida] arabinofermentans NRRL YB-2248]|uniref:DNA mismatch repair protein S5 domain-containing protein n=1 Tax=[Candida] arabinofermentans NRRL YB-2248 TaxID=983967 RepID=A0A1E4SYV0_9ASCO|nr:hypothetical protein CANARDRAFT_200946 [[Candida] arabinofermentans NRRL YB-2248]
MAVVETQRPRIRPLDKTVVNRIAAGEIIIAPSNALKELLENSIDAGSSSIDITCKDGGLKLLQITDNGSGISKDDLPILCERFTTSKLTKFEDLNSIQTYGFRGEALASISHISHFSVVTKTKQDTCAWKCHYSEGKLVPSKPSVQSSDPKPIAGKDGTSIIVEDLFYNFPSRLRSLKSANEEYSKIVDVINRYAIHTENVGLTCKKFGTTSNDVIIRNNMSRKDRIRTIFGNSVANELLDLDFEPNLDIGLFKCYGNVTNSNYTNKKVIQPVFFINNRLVSHDPLKRAINQVYTNYLPRGHKAFVYLALEINPKNVDVNVHPTKREVRFLNEDEIIEHIVKQIEITLSQLDSTRSFMTQQVLPNAKRFRQDDFDAELDSVDSMYNKKTKSAPQSQQYKKPYEHKLVRTDFNQSTITSFISTNAAIDLSTINRVEVKLKSVLDLRKEVETRTNKNLTEVFSKHTYIGIVDYSRRLLCIQYDVKLFLIDYASICNEFFYQIALSDFSNFGKIKFSEPISIRSILQENIYNDETILRSNFKLQDPPSLETVLTNYVEMAEMYMEYFSIEIDNADPLDPKLISIPMLIRGYTPNLTKLAFLLFKMVARVNWDDEKMCLGGILRQIALFYIPATIPNSDDPDSTLDDAAERENLSDILDNLIFPLLKKKFLATENLVRDVVEIANLPGLYKVFERC